MLIKTSILKKLPSGKYRLYSKKKGPDGKRRNLGTFDSLSAAKKHEADVHFFKAHNEDGEVDDFHTKTLNRLSNIATFLDEIGFKEPSDKIYAAMDSIDGSLDSDDEDYIVDMFVNTDNQTNVGGPRGEPGCGPVYDGSAGSSPSLFSVDSPSLVGREILKKLVKLANELDEKGLFDEADAIDEELVKIIHNLEEDRKNKKTQKMDPAEKEKQGNEAVARSNGRDGNSVTDNSNCGSFQGLSDAYMYRGYGDLEGAYGPA
ncbi:MAG: hypothetical protein WC523_00760 [Patescibacteria group bacterium]